MFHRHSIFWKLALLQILFVLLVVTLSNLWERKLVARLSFLPETTKAQLAGYAQQAEQAWREQGQDGLRDYLGWLEGHEQTWAVVIDDKQQEVTGRSLDARERQYLSFVRRLDGQMSSRGDGRPYIGIPFSEGKVRLVIKLPERFKPWDQHERMRWVIYGVVPGVLALLLGLALYALLIAPLRHLRRQAMALNADNLDSWVDENVSRRKDELGALGRALNHSTERLAVTVALQKQLLRDLSHELRTPLSRLQVACDSQLSHAELKARVEQEVAQMQRLASNTLLLAWLDTERPRLEGERIRLLSLWEVLAEDACFEHAWPLSRLLCELPEECYVQCNLSALAGALENILRNAIRHSPAQADVQFSGQLEGEYWHLRLRDWGPGVAPEALQSIFQPFTRLDGARPGDGGFGLGLSIARSAIVGQGGEIWAENASPGLVIHLRLPAA